MRVLITGGAGFIGSNLTRRLQADHPESRLLVIDDFRSGTVANLSDESESGWSFRGELLARSMSELDLRQVLDRFAPEIIFHEASITDTTVTDEAGMIRENVQPFKDLLDLAVDRNLRLVWASSGATYGRLANGAAAQHRPFRIKDAGCPANAYGMSKWLMENLHRQALADHPSAHLVGLRYFNVFGPGEQNKGHMASMIRKLTIQMCQGQRPRIFIDGDQARDHVYIDDVVDATLAAADEEARPGIYNVGSGNAVTFNEIITRLNEALETDLQADYFQNPYSHTQDYTCADLTETKLGLGWSPRRKSREAVKDYARWLKSVQPRRNCVDSK